MHQLEWTCVASIPQWLGVAEEDVAMTDTGETVLVSTAGWTAFVVPDGVTYPLLGIATGSLAWA